MNARNAVLKISDLCYELQCCTDLLLMLQIAIESGQPECGYGGAVHALWLLMDGIREKIENLAEGALSRQEDLPC